MTGQIRYRVSDRNLYAYVFAVNHPIAHVMGYFISVLRERIANFEAPAKAGAPPGPHSIDASVVQGISINDLRKNLRDLNEHMDRECLSSPARYGIVLDASLINVSNSTVRCLSNLPLGDMLANRHAMSQTVRAEVSPKSHEWGYKLGSIYIRKVHFRDAGMIKRIESKVVNRLRQVTSAIKQDGANQVSIITSTAEREAAIEFAKAAAIRPAVVGEALQRISADSDVSSAMFEILEAQKIIEGEARITLLPKGNSLLGELLATVPPRGKEQTAR